MRGSFRALAAAFALVLASGAAAAQAEQTRVLAAGDTGVTVRTRAPWPSALHKGYVPVLATVENASERRRRVEVTAYSGFAGDRREARALLAHAPGTVSQLELPVPVVAGWAGDVRLEVRVDGGQAFGTGGVASLDDPTLHVHPVVVLVPRAVPGGIAARWSELLATEWLSEPDTTPPWRVGFHGGAHVFSEEEEEEEKEDEDEPKRPNVEVAVVPSLGAPRRFESYTSLDLVAIDTAEGAVPPEVLDAVLRYARTGGAVAFLGPRAEEAAREAVGELDPRLFALGLGGSEAPEPGRPRAYAYGLGLVLVGGGGELFALEDVALLGSALDREPPLVPGPFPHGEPRWFPRIPGFGELPYGALALLLVVFALVLGPVNFIVVKRRGKPALLLATIPALSLAFTLAVVGYGLLHHGLGVKAVRHTWSVLDQRAHRVATVEARTFFAGLAFEPGLAPGPGTAVFPLSPDGGVHSFRAGAETLLAGAFYPARRRTSQVVLHDGPARGRLGVDLEDGALVAENGLGVKILELVVRDADGGWHRAPGWLAAGGRAALEEVSAREAEVLAGKWRSHRKSLPQRQTERSSSPHYGGRVQVRYGPKAGDEPVDATLFPGGARIPRTGALPPGSYAARLESSPFSDECGLDLEEVAGEHVVLGLLAEGAR